MLAYKDTPMLAQYYDSAVIFLLILGLVQSFTLFYNSLYEAKDLKT